MLEWTEAKASDYCLSVRDGTHDSPKPVDDGRFLITSRHIVQGDVDLSNAYQISQKDFDEINRRSKVDQWDVLFTMIGTVGEVCLIKEAPTFAIKNMGLFKSKDELSGRWLHYFLKSPDTKRHIETLKRGTTQSYVPLGELRNLVIRHPSSRHETEKIVSLLTALDDKIENNRRMNETLEEMAQAIFKSWFVDFDPVHAKAKGEQPTHMDAETAALFPAGFGDDGVPAGWTAGVVGDLAENPKRTVKPSEISEDVPYIGLEHMPRKSIALTDWEHAGKVTSNKSEFKKGEVLYGKLRPYFHKVGIAPLNGICSTDIVVVKAKSEDWRAYLASCLSTKEFVDHTDRTSTGTKMPRTNWKDMSAYEITIPDEKIAKALQTLVSPMHEKILSNIDENRSLASMRDALLPKLMSGEVVVSDNADHPT